MKKHINTLQQQSRKVQFRIDGLESYAALLPDAAAFVLGLWTDSVSVMVQHLEDCGEVAHAAGFAVRRAACDGRDQAEQGRLYRGGALTFCGLF